MTDHPTRDCLEEFAHDVLEDSTPVEQHVASCGACSRVVESCRLEEGALRELLSLSATRPARRRWLPWAAAAALLVAALGALAVRPRAHSMAVLEQVRGRVEVVARHGRLEAVPGQPLRPGHGVRGLESGSLAVFRFPDSGTVELRGEGHVDLSEDGVLILDRGWVQVVSGVRTVRTSSAEVSGREAVFSLAAGVDHARVDVRAGSVGVTRRMDGRSVVVGEGCHMYVDSRTALAPRESVSVRPIAPAGPPDRQPPSAGATVYELVVPQLQLWDPDDPDRRRPAQALFDEALRLETEDPRDLFKAILKFKKAYASARNEGKADLAAASLVRLAYCREKLEPPNVEEALEAYREVLADFASVEKWAAVAREKLALRGVDVVLGRLEREVRAWRDTAARSPLALEEARNAAWEKIRPLDREAVPGLLRGLDHADEVVRDFAADRLAEVADEAAVAAVVGRSAVALEKILGKHARAAEVERMADALEEDRDLPGVADRIAGHRRRAAEVRGHLPPALATPAIEEALAKALAGGSAAAARAIGQLGRISGRLVEALAAGLAGPKEVREACARAAGAVDPESGPDRQRLAGALMEIVQREPEKGEGDPENDATARQAAAEALGRIGLVSSVPALVEALDDNDVRVRHAARAALCEAAGRDFGYEADRPRDERLAGQSRAGEWWRATRGVDVLVERFRAFQAAWRKGDPERFFDPEALLDDAAWRREDLSRARRAADEFRRRADLLVRDAVELGPEAFERFLPFLGDPAPAVRRYAAEACAGFARPDALREILLGDASASRRAAAARALRGEIEPLRRALADPSAEVREAAALGLAGDPEVARALADPEPRVQIATLRALGTNEAEGRADLATKSPDPRVRALAVRAVAAADPLLRARRDPHAGVREEATRSIRRLGRAEPFLAVLRDEHRRADDRAGAALALGDLACAAALVERLGDPDAAVRIAVCEALEAAKARTRAVLAALLRVMSDEAEREAVRDAACRALRSLAGEEAAPFRASDPAPARTDAARRWAEWLQRALPD